MFTETEELELRCRPVMSTSIADRPTAMLSWEKEAVQDLDCVYQSKSTPDRGDVDAVWQSMYEKGLKRKVSQFSLPPQGIEINGNSSDLNCIQKDTEPRRDLATIHLERARNLGKLGMDEGRRYRKRAYSANSCPGDQQHCHATRHHDFSI